MVRLVRMYKKKSYAEESFSGSTSSYSKCDIKIQTPGIKLQFCR